MHPRLGSATLSPLTFPQGKQPKFPVGKIPMGQYSCKNEKYFFQKSCFRQRGNFHRLQMAL